MNENQKDPRDLRTSTLVLMVANSKGAPLPDAMAAAKELDRRVPIPVRQENTELIETLVAMVRRVTSEIPSKQQRMDVEADLNSLLKAHGKK